MRKENKLGSLGETSESGYNTFKTEIPIVDWNHDWKLNKQNFQNQANPENKDSGNKPGKMNMRHPGPLRNIILDKSLIRWNKDYLNESINRIKQITKPDALMNF